MKNEFYKRANDLFWSHRWTQGANPFVCFSNPQVLTNIIYSLDELKVHIGKGGIKTRDITIPLRVLQIAYNELRNPTAAAA